MSLKEENFQLVRDFVFDRTAIVLDEGKGYLVEARLMPIMRDQELTTLDELIDMLRKGDRNIQNLIADAMTTNETSFFRDSRPFDVLKTDLLPDIISARSNEKTLNIWCAACSSGQEPLTIAMVIREHFPELASWDVKIMATDISVEMIARASKGQFNQIEMNRGLPVQYLVKYFEKSTSEASFDWQIKQEILDMITFREMNLIEKWPVLPRMDVIFIRNVLIYFNTDTKKDIFKNLCNQFRGPGYLFLGAAETTLNLTDSLTRLPISGMSVYQLEQKEGVAT